jgi:hypothetical protein
MEPPIPIMNKGVAQKQNHAKGEKLWSYGLLNGFEYIPAREVFKRAVILKAVELCKGGSKETVAKLVERVWQPNRYGKVPPLRPSVTVQLEKMKSNRFIVFKQRIHERGRTFYVYITPCGTRTLREWEKTVLKQVLCWFEGVPSVQNWRVQGQDTVPSSP